MRHLVRLFGTATATINNHTGKTVTHKSEHVIAVGPKAPIASIAVALSAGPVYEYGDRRDAGVSLLYEQALWQVSLFVYFVSFAF